MKQTLNIYTAQINPTVGDISGNRKLILEHYAKAMEAQADLCVLPEAVLCGYTPADLILRPSFIQDLKYEVLESIIPLIGETALILSTPWQNKDDKKTYNAAHFIYNGAIKKTVYKQCLPNFSVMDEKRVFAEGINDSIISFKGINIGLLICHDTWWPEVSKTLKEKGADVFISINASPYTLNKEDFRIEFCKERTQETHLPILYTNLVGGQDEILFDGRTFTLNPNEAAENKFTAWKTESRLLKLIQTEKDKYIFENGVSTPNLEHQENIYQGLCLGFSDYMKKCGFKKVVIGISGGIDSALTASIATDVLGYENVTGILLPSQFTSDHSNNDALQLAQNLNIQTYTLPIQETVHALEKILSVTGKLQDVTIENLQARVRGTLLMGYANNTGSLLLTTGNKSEVAVGFCTLYGDMNGGFNIIKDLYKTEVYTLSRHINRNSEIIPQNSIDKEPTPELRENQKDSDKLPPYEILDAILQLTIEDKKGHEEIIEKGFETKTVQDVLRLLKISEHKRYQGAPGIKIHGTAFGLDWRYPLAHKYIY
jgi:NAD+ synthetase